MNRPRKKVKTNSKKYQDKKSRNKLSSDLSRKKQRPRTKKKSSNRRKIERAKLQNKKIRKQQRRNLLRDIGVTLFLFSLILMLLMQTVFYLPKVEGYSMTPTMTDGDRLFVNRLGEMKRFDLVCFRNPHNGDITIRRIIGLPGEEISYKQDQLYVNQKEVIERFLQVTLFRAKQDERIWTDDFTLRQIKGVNQNRVPEGHYFVLGDNRPYASDSRFYGFVDEEAIIGTVEMRLLPFHAIKMY